ncbi:hypothetical protein [Pontibacter ruber]|uniref:Uncharacterized protein n=1 Tax=Pontibacter ruber TaxID=1343895 RepID=A0ABW5D125_9BACT|nr:hypothetical protein [Pontibacter ruber]
MIDLNRLHEGLLNSTTLVVKDLGKEVECSFIKEGLVTSTFNIEEDVLIAALREKGLNGIVEGTQFATFKNNFKRFTLCVKARRLFKELCYSLPEEANTVVKQPAYKEAMVA